MRSLVLQEREMDYIKAATVDGSNTLKLMFKHILPNAISPMVIAFFHTMAGAIIAFAGIGFLGLSQGINYADWGTDLNWAKARFSASWAAFWPGLFIGIAAIGFMLIGDGLRDALDPRLHFKTRD
jgi:peptide/nickel transport system permease protein